MFSTDALHAGYEPDSLYGAINIPIYASSTFAQNAPTELRNGYEYSRVGNPTVHALEQTVAALEGATYALAFASGMAAIDTLLRALLQPGDRVIMGHDAYGGTYRLLNAVYRHWGIEIIVLDMHDLKQIEAALHADNAARTLIWLETPSNPLLDVVDIAAIAALKGDAKLIVDNTFASPYLQQPLSLGADASLHSATKYLAGHSDLIGGVIAVNDEALNEKLRFLLGAVGAIASPFDAYLSLRGIKTLSLRMQAHCRNAQAVADHLRQAPQVTRVYYPDESATARRQMRAFGGMVSFELATPEAAHRFVTSTKLICLAESLGGVESLVDLPARMTHLSATGSPLELPSTLVRLSIGIEDIEDILADIAQALKHVQA